MNVLIIVVAVLLVFSFIRIIMGPSVWDRLLGLNLLSIKITILIVLVAAEKGQTFLLDIALAYAFLSIIGVIFMSRFIQRKGKI